MNQQKPDNTFRNAILCTLAVIAFFAWLFHKAGILDDIIRSFVALFFTR